MIQKVKYKPFDMENVLDAIDPKWKEKPLYKWQWDEGERPDLNHLRILSLKDYSIKNLGDYQLYQKGKNFVIVTNTMGYFINVLTNIEPKKTDSFLYHKQETQELTIDNLLI